MLEKLKNRMNQVTQVAKSQADKMLQATRVSQEVRDHRLNLCESCEHLYKPTTTCKKCGCFMNIKTWIAMSRCPVGKWEAVKIDDQQQPPSAT